MKNKIFSLFGLFLVATFVTSCDDQDVSPIISVNKPTMTIDFPTAITVNEGTEIPYTITLSEPVGQEFNVYVVMDQPNSTADGLDSDVSESSVNTTSQKLIVFPPFTTTISGVITINEDDLAEPTEVLTLNFGETRTSAVNFEPVVSKITITNNISNDLVLGFHFDKSFTGTTGYTNSLCELSGGTPVAGYDIDFLLWDDAFADTGNLTAQTASCDEVMTIDINDLDVDPITGSALYHVIALLFTNGGLNQAITSPLTGLQDFSIPITVDYLRSGSINTGTFTQESSNWFKASTAEGDLQLVVDLKVTTVGGVRKVSIMNTLDDTVFATGKIKSKGKFISKRKK